MAVVIKTDQSRCFDADGRELDCAQTGQDGEMRCGRRWPVDRFEARGDVAVDRLSGLMWTRESGLTGFPRTWREALGLVAQMNHEAAFGFSDWRLPERSELFGLVSHARINPALPPDAPFENVFSGYYWSATACSRLADQAWYVHLGGGRIYRGMKHGSYMVWPVRGHLKDCGTDTGARGAPSGDARNSSGATGRFLPAEGKVYDRHTRLEWAATDPAASAPASWTAALDSIRRMNEAALHGHADWRLPNVRELESLIDLRRHSPALSAGHPFVRVPEGCWSSTTSVYQPGYAWVVYLRDGAVGVGYKKQAEFHVSAVRGACN
jgi:hypothetical protein